MFKNTQILTEARTAKGRRCDWARGVESERATRETNGLPLKEEEGRETGDLYLGEMEALQVEERRAAVVEEAEAEQAIWEG